MTAAPFATSSQEAAGFLFLLHQKCQKFTFIMFLILMMEPLAHVKMTGRTRRRGRKYGGHQRHGKRCLDGFATSRIEPLDPNMVTKAREILFRTATELARGNRRREALRACPDMFFAIVQIGGAETAGRHQCRRHDDVSKENSQVRNAKWSRPGTRATSTPHTLQCTPLKTAPSSTNVLDRQVCWAPASSKFSVPGGKGSSQQWYQRRSIREVTNTSHSTGTDSSADEEGKGR